MNLLTYVIFVVCLLFSYQFSFAKERKNLHQGFALDSYTQKYFLSLFQEHQTIDTIKQKSIAEQRGQVKEQVKQDSLIKIELSTIDVPKISSGWLVAISMVLPGFGQIYNESYWKLPIVYGVISGLLYLVIDQNQKMVDANTNYQTNLQANTEQKKTSSTDDGNLLSLAASYRNAREAYREARDTWIALFIVGYALSLVDVYVDAQLKNFEVKEVREQPRPTSAIGSMQILSVKLLIP